MKKFNVKYKKTTFGQTFQMTITDLNETTVKDIKKRLDDKGYDVVSVKTIK
jgi:hypothetical protein